MQCSRVLPFGIEDVQYFLPSGPFFEKSFYIFRLNFEKKEDFKKKIPEKSLEDFISKEERSHHRHIVSLRLRATKA